jgi:hypothetical protein
MRHLSARVSLQSVKQQRDSSLMLHSNNSIWVAGLGFLDGRIRASPATFCPDSCTQCCHVTILVADCAQGQSTGRLTNLFEHLVVVVAGRGATNDVSIWQKFSDIVVYATHHCLARIPVAEDAQHTLSNVWRWVKYNGKWLLQDDD